MAGAEPVAHFSSLSITLFHEKVKLGNEQSFATALSRRFQRTVPIPLGTVVLTLKEKENFNER
jgi:hypothetical protein